MSCTREQLNAAMDAIWSDLEARYNTIEDVKARLCLELWPEPVEMPASAYDVLTVHAGDSGELPSEAESEGTKRGRKKGPMSEEAKSKMVAKRAATLAAKAAGIAPEPKAPKEPKSPKEPKVKLTKEERSAAAKARYAALSDEGKAAIRERLVNAKAAAKAAKTAV